MTIFLATRYPPPDRPFPVSLLARERFYTLLQIAPLEQALAETLLSACGIDAPDQDDMEYLQSRMAAAQKEGKPTAPAGRKLRRGLSYREFLAGLPFDRLLLLACQGDLLRAEKLYCDVDQADAMAFVDAWVRLQVESFEYVFQAALYASGGSLEGDRDDDRVDATGLSANDLMRQFGAH